MSKYFTADETVCHCGCGGNLTTDLLYEKLDELREVVGGPLELNCAYRCPTHNAEVGSVPNSQHVAGTAADVAVPEGMTVDELADIAAGIFDGVGRYYDANFVHCDVRAGCTDINGYTWVG